MASVSVSHAVMFIASLVIAATVAGALVTGVDRISNSMTDRSLDASEEIRTDVEIISDTGSDAIYDAEEERITLLVKNTGSLNLDAHEHEVDVLVDGQFAPNVTVESLEGDDDAWLTGSVVRIEIQLEQGLDAGDHRVKLIVNGDEEVLRFRV